MRAILKTLIEGCLTGLGGDTVARFWNRNQTAVLAYHNVVPDGERRVGDRSLHLPREEFSRQLDLLLETHEVVPLSTLLSEQRQGPDGKTRMRAAITFDDAYRGALTAGLEEVSRRELPATIFVSPKLLEQEGFWWDLLSSARSGTVADSVREFCLAQLHGHQERIIEWARTEDLLEHRSVPDHMKPSTVELVRTAAAQPDITLAMHGWLHLDFTSCTSAELRAELRMPLRWFSEHALPFENWLAFPYGRHPARIVRHLSTRYTLAFTTAGETSSNYSSRTVVPRINIPAGISLHNFRLMTSGLRNLTSFRRDRPIS